MQATDRVKGTNLKERHLESDSSSSGICPFGVALESITRYRLGLRSNQAVSDYLKARGLKKGFSAGSIGAYIKGETAPHPRKLEQMLDTFEATLEEREWVRRAYWATEWKAPK